PAPYLPFVVGAGDRRARRDYSWRAMSGRDHRLCAPAVSDGEHAGHGQMSYTLVDFGASCDALIGAYYGQAAGSWNRYRVQCEPTREGTV
ncbi:MAG TPA: hypothetical protein VFG00_14510, partial [Acidothermaceae bacterium]|nr:hypothetical protein [Acidothermaceae bacterium]